MERATFKAGVPNYEYNRDGIYAHFNGDGLLVTNDAKVIAALSTAQPFIKRVDEQPKAAPKKTRAKTPKK